jgi:hypothetical protein
VAEKAGTSSCVARFSGPNHAEEASASSSSVALYREMLRENASSVAAASAAKTGGTAAPLLNYLLGP